MKKLLLLSVAIFSALTSFSQNTTYSYNFDYGLNEVFWQAPKLTTTTSCMGSFNYEALPIGISKNTYRFTKGCGLVFDDSTNGLVASGTYTIELYFKLDTITGYKKLIDFDSLGKDAGVYNQKGKIVLYPSLTNTDSMITDSVYQYVAITRDAGTKYMYVNCNGKTVGTYTDNSNNYVYGINKKLVFFQDDLGTNGEQTSGAVAMIRISNYAMDSATIKSNYTGLSSTLNVANTQQKDILKIYPNPVKNNMHIVSNQEGNYEVYDLTGKVVLNGTTNIGDNIIATDKLYQGIYIIKLTNNKGSTINKFIKE